MTYIYCGSWEYIAARTMLTTLDLHTVIRLASVIHCAVVDGFPCIHVYPMLLTYVGTSAAIYLSTRVSMGIMPYYTLISGATHELNDFTLYV